MSEQGFGITYGTYKALKDELAAKDAELARLRGEVAKLRSLAHEYITAYEKLAFDESALPSPAEAGEKADYCAVINPHGEQKFSEPCLRTIGHEGNHKSLGGKEWPPAAPSDAEAGA